MDFTTAATGAWAIGFASIVNENGYESVLNLMRHRTGRCDGRSGDMVCEKQNNAKVQTSEQMKAMPDCTGKSLEEAKQLLNNTGIKNISEPVYEYNTKKKRTR